MEPLSFTHTQTASAFCERPSPLATDGVVAMLHPTWERRSSGTPLWLIHLPGDRWSLRQKEYSNVLSPEIHPLGWSVKLGDSWKLFATVPKTATDSDLNLSSLCKFARPRVKACASDVPRYIMRYTLLPNVEELIREILTLTWDRLRPLGEIQSGNEIGHRNRVESLRAHAPG